MDFEKAYRKTLTKWQGIAAGDVSIHPESVCGLCEWAKGIKRLLCLTCPAYHHYGEKRCASAFVAIGDAIDAHEYKRDDNLKRHAQLVVEELLAIKASLFVEATKIWIASQKS